MKIERDRTSQPRGVGSLMFIGDTPPAPAQSKTAIMLVLGLAAVVIYWDMERGRHAQMQDDEE